MIADMLVEESLRGRHRVAAATLILDRLEGRPPQQVNLNNITQDIAGRTDVELRHYRYVQRILQGDGRFSGTAA
jgi:hypothetical protein